MTAEVEKDILAGRINAAMEEWDSIPAGQGHSHLASHVAVDVLAAGYRKARTIHTAEELDALPDDALVEASGDYPGREGGFTECWIRPIPAHITGGQGKRVWEVLIYLDGGGHNITHAELIKFPATVLHEPEVRA